MTHIDSHYALPVGTLVQEYRIIDVLGIGGFGIVYKAENKFFTEMVALKEFLPQDMAYRSEGEHRVLPLSSSYDKAFHWAREKFLSEAKTLRELGTPKQHPNIVRVHQFIEANGTAYMVMAFEEGRSLADLLDERGTLGEAEVREILKPLLNGLSHVHRASVWHRDIKPSNILIRPNGSPVLIDFGAARKDISSSDRSTIVVFTTAYAALEQIYPIGNQGPWTDIYALGATFYQAVTGSKPATAGERHQGKPFVSAKAVTAKTYSLDLLTAIDAALALYPHDRPQSISQWETLLRYRSAPEGDKTVQRIRFDDTSQKDDPPQTQLKKKKRLTFFMVTMILMILLLLLVPKTFPPIQNNSINKDLNTATGTEQIEQHQNKSPHDERRSDGASEGEKNPLVIQATLEINSVPPQAQVYLNGNLEKGLTPLNLTVGDGTHSLRLHLEGHYDWQGNIIVEARGHIPIRIPLQQK